MSDHTDDRNDDPGDADLKVFDLTAWEAPPPPRGLADAAIARAMATDEAIAVTVQRHRRHRRRNALAISGAAVALAASAAVWLGLSPGPSTDGGIQLIAAPGPRHVQLGDSTADLEPGTTLQTQRIGNALHVVQSGTATWSVAARDQIVIDAGSSASIEATGASLRVETQMNLADVRIASGIAVTAAVVALATVTVYEGYVKATSDGEGVVVRPHDTLQLTKSKLDRVEMDLKDLVLVSEKLAASRVSKPLRTKGAGDFAIAPGDSAHIEIEGIAEKSEAIVEIDAPCELRVEFHRVDANGTEHTIMVGTNKGSEFMPLGGGTYTYTATCAGGTDQHGTLVVDYNYCGTGYCSGEDTRLVKLAAPVRGAVFHEPTLHVEGKVLDGTKLSVGDQAVPIGAGGAFSVDLAYTAGESLALRADHPKLGTQFYVQRSGLTGPAQVVMTLPVGDDQAAAEAKLMEAERDLAALQQRIADAKAAASVGGSAGEASRRPLIEMTVGPDDACNEDSCVLDDYKGACCARLKANAGKVCDATAAVNAGNQSMSTGSYSAALKHYTDAWHRCPEHHAAQLAFMAACAGKDVRPARQFWALFSERDKNRLLIMCIRSGITRDILDAPGAAKP